MRENRVIRKKIINELSPEGMECLSAILDRKPSEEEFSEFMSLMVYCAEHQNDRNLVERQIKGYVYGSLPRGSHQYALNFCRGFVRKIVNERHKHLVKIYNFETLKETLGRTPTEEELEIYEKNRRFLIGNEPSQYEPDCHVVYAANERLRKYLGDCDGALDRAKERYAKLSVMKKVLIGQFRKPDWLVMADSREFNDELLDALYKDDNHSNSRKK